MDIAKRIITDRVLADLRIVGPDKAVGCLPLATLERIGIFPERLSAELADKNIETMIVHGEVYDAFYAYHSETLTGLLAGRSEVLAEHQWPGTAAEFITQLANVQAENDTPLCELIAETFADRGNKCRVAPKVDVKSWVRDFEEAAMEITAPLFTGR